MVFGSCLFAGREDAIVRVPVMLVGDPGAAAADGACDGQPSPKHRQVHRAGRSRLRCLWHQPFAVPHPPRGRGRSASCIGWWRTGVRRCRPLARRSPHSWRRPGRRKPRQNSAPAPRLRSPERSGVMPDSQALDTTSCRNPVDPLQLVRRDHDAIGEDPARLRRMVRVEETVARIMEHLVRADG